VLRTLRNSVALLLALLASAVLPAHAANPLAYPSLFGTREIASSNTAQFWRWHAMLARWHEEERQAHGPCPDGIWKGCEPKEWTRLVRELRGLSDRDKIERVNAALNRYPYTPSWKNWDESNYWETPFEFLHKSGQCQDYAIAKFMTLRAAGMPSERLRIVVLRDTRLQLDHAVVVAYVDGEALMLDNQFPRVMRPSQVSQYRPYYSINESGWWLHLPNPVHDLPQEVAAK
jgi:predicted transglutaminase-like cysteine proteinase